MGVANIRRLISGNIFTRRRCLTAGRLDAPASLKMPAYITVRGYIIACGSFWENVHTIV